jgi:hypothetical protein
VSIKSLVGVLMLGLWCQSAQAKGPPKPSPVPADTLMLAWDWDGEPPKTWLLTLAQTSNGTTRKRQMALQSTTCPAGTRNDPDTVPASDEATQPTAYCGTLACPGAGAYTAMVQAKNQDSLSEAPAAEDLLSFGMTDACAVIPYEEALTTGTLPAPTDPGQSNPQEPEPPASRAAPGPGPQPQEPLPGEPAPHEPPAPTAPTGLEELRQQFAALQTAYEAAQTRLMEQLKQAMAQMSSSNQRQRLASQTLLMEALNSLFENYAQAVAQWSELVVQWATTQTAPGAPVTQERAAK